jgi:hypothetical protein
MSAVAETGRSGLAQAADRSTSELDLRDRSRLNWPQLRPPSGCFHQARAGAVDLLQTALAAEPQEASRAVAELPLIAHRHP